jgi:CRISPR system Cascade subunit CasA
MMNPTFNLVEEAWIPAVHRGGQTVTLGLQDVLLQAHDLQELSARSPLETAALYRLLLAILHRVFGPSGYDVWDDLWSAGRVDAQPLTDYLDTWYPRFGLFDEAHPFYQAPDDRVKPKPPNKLLLDLAFGNKATLFDHHTDAEGIALTTAEAARAVVAAQCFGLAGLSGIRGATFTDGACTRGVLFMVQGKNLFETLMLNLLRYPTEDDVLVHRAGDRPAWEMDDPLTPERTRPLGYLDYLTWQNRRILLFPEQTADGICVREMTMGPGLRLDDDILDPMKHYREGGRSGWLVQRFWEERALWRDSAALFKLHDENYHPPQTFRWLSELVEEDFVDKSQTRRYMALGMANSRAKVDFYRAEQMPLPLDYLTDEMLVGRLEEALGMAEDVRGQLWSAARTLARFVLAPEADQGEEGHEPHRDDMDALMTQWAIERDYWVRLELPFRHLMETLPQDIDAAMTAWREIVRRTAWHALDRIAADIEHDPRKLKATVRARGRLARGLKKVLESD